MCIRDSTYCVCNKLSTVFHIKFKKNLIENFCCSGFFPVAINFLRRVPILGTFLNMPGISAVSSPMYNQLYNIQIGATNLISKSVHTHSANPVVRVCVRACMWK